MIEILGLPMSLGASRRGCDLAPTAFRYVGLQRRLSQLGCSVIDHGDLISAEAPQQHRNFATQSEGVSEGALYLIQDYLSRIPDSFTGIDNVRLFLGGDHSVSRASIQPRSSDDVTGIVWIDAHCDLSTSKTSKTGNLHGMVLASLLGEETPFDAILGTKARRIVEGRHVIIIGARDISHFEQELIERHGIRVFPVAEIDQIGIPNVAEETLALLKDTSSIHLSIDADVFDTALAPGVGTPVAGGLSYREGQTLLHLLAQSSNITGIELVEVNPMLDRSSLTATAMTDLIVAFFQSRYQRQQTRT